MSLESWKREFYLVPAGEIAKTGTDVELIEHALTKWRGMRKDNLGRHGLLANGVGDIGGIDSCEFFVISDRSCSLCRKFSRPLPRHKKCQKCPIVSATGNTCDGAESPWMAWVDCQDPEPMIKVLEKALEFVKSEAANEAKCEGVAAERQV